MKHLKIVSVLAIAIILASCSSANQQRTKGEYDRAEEKFRKTITAGELQKHLYTYASDEFQGRLTSTPGQKIAAKYLQMYYQKMKIKPPAAMNNSYYQVVPKEYINQKRDLVDENSENVLAYIEGSEFPNEVVVVSAHLDHIGIVDGKVCNGADDDGSGTVALLEIAEALKMAKDKGFGPKRSVLFLHVTGEELGLWGSSYYSDNPIFPLENTVADLNIDMIGRVDDAHLDKPYYVYPIGADMLSQDLHNILVETNNKTTKLDLDFTYNKKDDPNRFYYRSDHYNFAKHNVPVIFFFNGVHADYHQPTDTPDKIDYKLLATRAQLVFAILWEVANRDERLKLKEGV